MRFVKKVLIEAISVFTLSVFVIIFYEGFIPKFVLYLSHIVQYICAIVLKTIF